MPSAIENVNKKNADILKIFLKVGFLPLKTRKKMKKYLPISEPAGYQHTLFIYTLAVVFEGHRIL